MSNWKTYLSQVIANISFGSATDSVIWSEYYLHIFSIIEERSLPLFALY